MMKVTDIHRARVIKRATKVENIPILVEAGQAKGENRPQAKVRLIDGGVEGTKIEVYCPCGEKIVIICEFDSETA
ncbi:MAG: hypothetical protein KJ645_12990 [Planctomycetes bacterium]|nr:hypothetical protein [Planctomycetota bacterium]